MAASQAQYQQDVTDWENDREALDNEIFRPLRHEFRVRTQAIIDAPDISTTKTRAEELQNWLAHKDTEDEAPSEQSLAKRLHTATRVFGDVALRTLRRHLADVS